MSTLYVDNLQPNLGSRVMAAGHVVQVVEASDGTWHNFNNTNGWLNLTASITPTSTSSKVLVKVHLDGVTREDDTASYGGNILYRNRGASQVQLAKFGYPMGWASVDNASGTTIYCQFLDSPSTTSSTSYDVYWEQVSGAAIQQFNRDGPTRCRSSIVLMEIAQ
jgi:hypothetical protein